MTENVSHRAAARGSDARAEAPLWEPSEGSLRATTLSRYLDWLADRRGLRFTTYHDLWRWSVDDLDGFWASVWEFFGLDSVSGYEQVLADDRMPGARWFTGARLNFAERCLASGRDEKTAVLAIDEDGTRTETSYADLRRQVGVLAATLRASGVRPGDSVAGYLPNICEAVVAMLAAASVGAVWTAASPDFGTTSVLDRFGQAEPVVLFAADGYRYGGKRYDRRDAAAQIVAALPSVHTLVRVGYVDPSDATPWLAARRDGTGPTQQVTEIPWEQAVSGDAQPDFADLPFDHPLWVLWSSGTTGTPKGIVQGHGGITVELLKALSLGCDVQEDDRYFFITSTSWMVWNFLVGALMLGSTIICYDGSPVHPDVDGAWRVAEATGATLVGVGAGYLIAGHKADANPSAHLDLSALRAIQQTGSTLPPEAWHWTCENVKPGVWLQSITGGTDVCSLLAGASPLVPVYAGRISAPALGVHLQAWDENGKPVVDQEAEMVVTRPMPSMPLHFLGDHDGRRYHDSYFTMFPGVWRHGDWITMHADDSVTVAGRSDSTLNRQGVRMGSADIYSVTDKMPEISDSLVVGVEEPDGGYYMPLFVVLDGGAELTDEVRDRIKAAIREQLSPRHVPDAILAVPAVPRTLTGKRLEVPVKRILQGQQIGQSGTTGAITHPEVLDWFAEHAQSRRAGRT